MIASTGGRQEQYVTSSLGGEIVAIVPGGLGAAPAVVRPNEAAEAWAAVKNSTSAAQLEVVATRYKGTVYADLAQARINELRKQQTALAAPPTPRPVTDPAILARLNGPLMSGDIFKECDVCPEMVVVPAGSFIMGSPEKEEGRDADEGPQQTVTIASFAIGKFEVTFAEWDACVVAGGCIQRPDDRGWGRDRRPVINVSWNDIVQEYLPWLSRTTGKTYRLPTEAEWEYSARARTTTPFSTGESISTSHANFKNPKGTVDVGSFPPNHFGLHDMHGNVWEWVQACSSTTYAQTHRLAAELLGNWCSRSIRGGSWAVDRASALRVANRDRGRSRLSWVHYRLPGGEKLRSLG